MTLKNQTRWKATLEEGEYVIRGKRGVIATYQDNALNVWITNLRVANALIVDQGWEPAHTYDDGADFVCTLDLLDEACKAIKARKKRQVTEIMRQRGRELAARMRSSKENPLLNDSKGT